MIYSLWYSLEWIDLKLGRPASRSMRGRGGRGRRSGSFIRNKIL